MGGSERARIWDTEVAFIQVSREPLEILAGERSVEGSSIAALDRGGMVSLGIYGALFGGMLTAGAIVELGPALAAEARLLMEAGRWGYVWSLTNPLAAIEIGGFFTGLGLEMAEDGVQATLERMTTLEGALMILVDILVARMAMGEPDTAPNLGRRSRIRNARTPSRPRGAGNSKVEAILDEVRARTRAFAGWAKEQASVSHAGISPDGVMAVIPGRSYEDHLTDARQQLALRKGQRGRRGKNFGSQASYDGAVEDMTEIRRQRRLEAARERKDPEVGKRAKDERRQAQEMRRQANADARTERMRYHAEAEERLKHVDQPLENTKKTWASRGHGHADHGYQTNLDDHRRRVETGRSPSGRTGTGSSKASAKFHDPEAEVEALGKAYGELQHRLRTTGESAMEDGEPRRITVVVTSDAPRGFGRGYRARRDGHGRAIENSRGGHEPEFVDSLTRASVTFEYIPSEDDWAPVTYYPLAR